jgi:hypothetical protein
MKLEDILAEWDKDSQFDRTKLDSVALGIPKLHAKYIRMLSAERMLLTKYEADFKTLKFDKYEFFDEGPNETTPKEWIPAFPARGKPLKADIPRYLEADKDIINMVLKIGLQKEKIEAIKAIIDAVKNMNWNVRNAIDYMRFMNGA